MSETKEDPCLNEFVLRRILEGQTPEIQVQVRRRLLISYWSQRSLAECPAELCPDTDDFAELPDPDFEEKVTELIKTYSVEQEVA